METGFIVTRLTISSKWFKCKSYYTIVYIFSIAFVVINTASICVKCANNRIINNIYDLQKDVFLNICITNMTTKHRDVSII